MVLPSFPLSFFFALFLLLVVATDGAIVSYDASTANPLTSDELAPSYVLPGVIASPLRFGSDLIRDNSGPWLFSNWETNRTFTPNANKSFTFTLTLPAGVQYVLTDVYAQFFIGAGGPQYWSFDLSNPVKSAFLGLVPYGNSTIVKDLGVTKKNGRFISKVYPRLIGNSVVTVYADQAANASGVAGLANVGNGPRYVGLYLQGTPYYHICSLYKSNCGTNCPIGETSPYKGNNCALLNDPCNPTGSSPVYVIAIHDPSTDLWTVNTYSDKNCTSLIESRSSACGDCAVEGVVIGCSSICPYTSASSALHSALTGATKYVIAVFKGLYSYFLLSTTALV